MTQRQTPRFPLDHSFASSFTSNHSSYPASHNQTYEIPSHLSRVHTDHVSYIPEPAHSSKYKQQRYHTKAQLNPSLKPRFSTNDLEDLLQKQIQSSSINTNPKQREPILEQREPTAYEKVPQKPRIQDRTSSSRTNIPPIRGLSALEAICSGSSGPMRGGRRQPVRHHTEAQSEIFSPSARSPTSRISKASLSIHEQYNESLQCIAIKDPKTVKQLENSSMSLFAGIIDEEHIQAEPPRDSKPKDWKFYQRSYSSGFITSHLSEGDKTIENCKSLISLKFRTPVKSKTLPVKTTSSQPRLQQRPSIQTIEDDFQRAENPTLSIMEDDEESEFDQDINVNMMIVNQTFGQNKVDSPRGSTSTDDSIKKQPSIEFPLSSVEKKSEAIQVDLIDLERNIIKRAPMKTYQERYVAPLKVEEDPQEIVTPVKEEGPITPTVTMSPEKANKVVAKKGFQSKINGNYYLSKNLSMASFPVKASNPGSSMGGASKLKVTQIPKANVNSQMSFTQGYLSCKI